MRSETRQVKSHADGTTWCVWVRLASFDDPRAVTYRKELAILQASSR
jgi:hypothetical protein